MREDILRAISITQKMQI